MFEGLEWFVGWSGDGWWIYLLDGFEFVEKVLDGLEEVLALAKWEGMEVKNYIKMEYRRVYIEKMVFYIWTTLIHV